ncbi:hypothetical protein [Streptomyces sp. NPDC102437]|uniref:hypothetical protein n=1 Tax=Streptomyces sp. NPDC102437 TaxID=3366175 RepID=UPI00382B84B3
MSTQTTPQEAGAFVQALTELASEYPTDPEGTALLTVTVTDPATGEQHLVPIEPGQLEWVTRLVRDELDTCRNAHSDGSGHCGHCRGTGLAGGTGGAAAVELSTDGASVMSVTPACPECETATEPILVEGEDLFRCLAPGCGRRTYGTGDANDDQDLPSYSEVDEDGVVVIYHGTGEPDFEATAEYRSQDGPDEEDGLDDEDPYDDGPGPLAPPAGPMVRDVRVKDLPALALGGAWVWIYGDERGWRFLADAEYDPAAGETSVTLTYGDGDVVNEEPWTQARLTYEQPADFPTAAGPARVGNQ